MSLLSTAASGLQSQQARLDALANNIANLNTTGYQASDVNFASALTEFYGQSPAVSNLPRQSPNGFTLGTGSLALAPQANFAAGTYTKSNNPLNMAVLGDGFFMVDLGNKQTGYTRAGDFIASSDSTGQMFLATPGGHYVLGANGKPINLTGMNLTTLHVSPNGALSADNAAGKAVNLGRLGLAYVSHPASALTSYSGQIYALNAGYTAVTNNNPGINSMKLMGQVQGYTLEGSNVNLTQEMTQMIQTQNNDQMAAKALNIASQMMTVADQI